MKNRDTQINQIFSNQNLTTIHKNIKKFTKEPEYINKSQM